MNTTIQISDFDQALDEAPKAVGNIPHADCLRCQVPGDAALTQLTLEGHRLIERWSVLRQLLETNPESDWIWQARDNANRVFAEDRKNDCYFLVWPERVIERCRAELLAWAEGIRPVYEYRRFWSFRSDRGVVDRAWTPAEILARMVYEVVWDPEHTRRALEDRETRRVEAAAAAG